MNRSLLKINLVVIMMMSGLPLEAARDRRNGFNFGTSLGIGTNQFRNYGGDSQSSYSKVSTESRSFSPYLGYGFSVFNFGISGNIETVTNNQHETTLDQSVELDRENISKLKSGSVFARLLFGRMLYFEFGAGLYYSQINETREESALGIDGNFTGNRSASSVRGVGPGYNVSLGIEIPVIAGFHVTSAYKSSLYSLRNYKSSNDLGAKQAQRQNSELSFGLAYYYE